MLPQALNHTPVNQAPPEQVINLDQIEADNVMIASYVNKIALLIQAGKQLHAENMNLKKQVAEAKTLIERLAMEKAALSSGVADLET